MHAGGAAMKDLVLKGVRVAILATDGVEKEELTLPRRSLDAAGKPIAAICHAPWLLVSAKLVKGRRLTSYYTLQDDVTCAGGKWEDAEVIVDRNWVTSRKPDDIPAFNREMRKLFAKTGSRAETQ